MELSDPVYDAFPPRLLTLFSIFSHNYGERQRRMHPMTTCPLRDNPRLLAITPSTEAAGFLIYENCHPKWGEMNKWRHVEGNKGKFPKYSAKHHEETKRWQTLYSDNCSGQDPYGGWSKEGLKRFGEITKMIKENRKDKEKKGGYRGS